MNSTIIVIAILGVVIGLFFYFRTSWIPANRARALLDQGARVIDVRRPDEFAEGALSGAINIPLDRLADELPKQFPDKNQPLLLHCLGGVRSQSGANTLRRLGYTKVHNLGSLSRARSVVEKTG